MSNSLEMRTSKIEEQLSRELFRLCKQSTKLLGSNIRVESSLTFSNFFENKLLIIIAIRHGIPYSLFKLIQVYAPFSEGDWAVYLGLSTKTLHRYKQDSMLFKPIHSERIIEMLEVTNIGLEVFNGNLQKYKLWLDTPNFALGRLKPIELLRDSYGKELVAGELIRIGHGILA